ncbi:carbohydrate ABC transporter permease [Rugosimonospora africana]|uniref:ABC transporter permease n=1 Tax=Rugosimonospora africana TaxID=556532 RepID=A0A8J3QTF1_9ACTN|nr:carbohydrate ABC transporter permease [Rugosimonospora africana]GIH15842.1 ABC transporter permease [Rugosimonospora africana]
MRETTAGRWVRRVALTLIGIFTLLPVLIILDTSVKPLSEVQNTFSWVPKHITLDAYVQMWQTVPLAHYFLNSIIVSVCSAAISVVLATLGAYAVSRFAFAGRRLFSFAVLSTQMFPGILFLLPLYLIFINLQRYLGVPLSGSLFGLIITYLTFALPFSIWMLIGFFDTIPRELEEAALVDGTTRWGALWRIVLPVARPGIIAVAIFAYMTAWGEVLFASVLTTESTRTLAIGLQEYATRDVTDWNQIMAASVVVSVPVVAGFLAVQRFLIRGLTAGAVK